MAGKGWIEASGGQSSADVCDERGVWEGGPVEILEKGCRVAVPRKLAEEP